MSRSPTLIRPAFMKLFGSIMIFAAMGAPLLAQTSSMLGRVKTDKSDQPLANAEILIEQLKLSTRTDSLGNFVIPNLPPGKHRILVRLIGYQSIMTDFEVRNGKEVEFDVNLKPSSTTLKQVDVKDTKTTGIWAIKLADFDERRATGIGKFLTADYFEAQDGRPLSSFIQQKIGGARIIQQNGRRFIASARGCGVTCPKADHSILPDENRMPSACYMQIIVNGIIRFNSSRGQLPFDLDAVQSKDIIGLEYYTGATTPLQFRNSSPNTMCGTVVIWTKGG